MPGKPWQSKACGTCKKRKIKCDENKPQCGQCVKHRVTCPGYQRGRIFIFENPEDKERKQGIGSAPPRRAVVARPTHRRSGEIGPVQTMKSGPMMRTQMFNSFYAIYFPRGVQERSSVDLWHHVITGISTQPNKTVMLEKAISALSCIYVGKLNGNKAMFNHGVELYNSSIQRMSDMIRRSRFHEDIIFTGVIFQDIETLYSPSGFETWLVHVEGVKTVLQHYRHKINAHSNPVLAAIYNQHQMTKKVFSWCMDMHQGEIDWEMETDATGPMIDTLKAFVDISKIAAAANSADISDPNAIQALLDKCLTFEKRQLKWYGSHLWYPGRGPLPSRPGEIKSWIPPIDNMFGTPYRFRLLDDARLHQMFWMSLSSLYTLIDQLEVKSLTAAAIPDKSPVCNIPFQLEIESPQGSSPRDPNLFDNSLQDPNLYNNPPDVSSSDLSEVYAEMIARTIPYCLQDSMNLWGVCFVCVSIKYIANTFIRSQNAEKFFWCQQILTAIGEHGFDFCVFLRDFLLKRWFEEVQQSPRTWEEMNEYSSVSVEENLNTEAVQNCQ